jgi:hypothetical protein
MVRFTQAGLYRARAQAHTGTIKQPYLPKCPVVFSTGVNFHHQGQPPPSEDNFAKLTFENAFERVRKIVHHAILLLSQKCAFCPFVASQSHLSDCKRFCFKNI